MADERQTVVLLTPGQSAAKQIASEMAERKASGAAPFNETRPGGYFLGADGVPHDSEGRPIAEDAAKAEPAAKAKK